MINYRIGANSIMHTVPVLRMLSFGVICLVIACSDRSSHQNEEKQKQARYVFTERLIKGRDTGMISLSGFRRVNPADILCQHWELENMEGVSSIELVMDPVTDLRIFPVLSFFKDSFVVENPRNAIRIGKWHLTKQRQPRLSLFFNDGIIKEYSVLEITSSSLLLSSKGIKDSLFIRLTSDAKVHQNMRNDPFYPENNYWRIKAPYSENDSAIMERVKQCLRFYAFYFRDCIKRNKKTISFLGLPMIFQWYSGGIGLPEKEKLHESWIACFYDRRQAIRGYEILRELIKDYEYEWPENAPSWVYQTHSVLEQMYLKLDSMDVSH